MILKSEAQTRSLQIQKALILKYHYVISFIKSKISIFQHLTSVNLFF